MNKKDKHSTQWVNGHLGFLDHMDVRPKFHANDQSLDVLKITPRSVPIENVRYRANAPSLDEEGFHLYPHKSTVSDFMDREQTDNILTDEMRVLLQNVTDADYVTIYNIGMLRFSERSTSCGALDNSRPARFVHIDCSDNTAQNYYRQNLPPDRQQFRRAAQYNLWRVMTPPPQDVPLAVCNARSLASEDLVPGDAVFDRDGKIVFSLESLLIKYNANQRWSYYSDMHPDEVLVFKTNDSDPRYAHHVAHGAFNDPSCPQDSPPRASLETRGIAYWF